MTRRTFAKSAGWTVLGSSFGLARADDLGRVFEKAARKAAKNALGPAGGPSGAGGGIAGAVRGESFPIQTADGWTLVIHRYRPSGAPKPGAMPVILCHGLTYNASFW